MEQSHQANLLNIIICLLHEEENGFELWKIMHYYEQFFNTLFKMRSEIV